MKREPSLRKQPVKRRKQRILLSFIRVISLVGASFIKFSCLVIALVVISLLFLSVYQYLLTSPYIRLERVIVTGVDERVKSRLLKTSGLSYDLSLLAINLKALKQRLEKDPWIKSVELEKRFPHTLIIRAEKEKPCAVVAMDKLYFMNKWGRIIKEVDPADKIDYPVITGVSMIKTGMKKLKIVALVMNTLGSRKGLCSLEDISEIHVKKAGFVSIYFRFLPAVVETKADNLGVKMDRLQKVVKHLNRSGRIHMVRSINLDYRDGVLVSFKNS
ncbi:MAG: FtsQ-type POTRA domain-containing protein [Thermodesulfobacteriota bacterium]|nr:FtsQ-type POTRA domain-containing protein [Thermodesulfobacteriota bacterium]